MLAARFAPIAVVAALSLGFTWACDGEKTVADAAVATGTGPEPSAHAIDVTAMAAGPHRATTNDERPWVEQPPLRRRSPLRVRTAASINSI